LAFGSVCIGFCHPDVWLGAPLFYSCLRDTFRADNHGARRIQDREIEVVGSQIDVLRNDIVEAFLAHPDRPHWLLMIDADMTWTPQDVTRLLEAADEKERPIMGGLCFAERRASGGKLWPTLMVFEPGPDGRGVAGVKDMTDWPRGEVCKVDTTGAAFLLVHRSVYERMRERAGPYHPAPWFAITYLPMARLGEDTTFCLRCRGLGVPIYVHTGVSIGHVKQRVLTEAMFDAQQATLRDEKPLLTLAQ
jgi:hypothetical protein